MPSIVEVAKQANVSIATVSRVLSGSAHPVSEQTRSRVLQAATALNYSPSALAKALVKGSTRIVGVIVGDATDPYFAAIVRGVEDVARACGYLVIVCNSDRVPAIELRYLKTLDEYRADGVIFAGGGLTDPAYVDGITHSLEAFRTRGAAIVSLGKHLFPSLRVLVDNRQMVIDAMAHLTGLGHRRIAYISGPEALTTSALRLSGYRSTLTQSGLPSEAEYVLEGDYTYEGGLRAAGRLAQLRPPPTAILASNDLMAIGCLVGLKKAGLRVPSQISIMGIDNITAAQFVEPPLTTIAIPLHELGAMAMECLVKLHQGDAEPEAVMTLAHQLVIREFNGSRRRTMSWIRIES